MRDYLSKESKFLLGSGALKKAPGPFFYDFFPTTVEKAYFLSVVRLFGFIFLSSPTNRMR